MALQEILVPPLDPEGCVGVPLSEGAEPTCLLVTRFHAFGDAVITLPVLAALRRRLPRTRILFVSDVRWAGFFERVRWVDRVLSLDTRARRPVQFAQLARLVFAVRRERVDTVLDLHRSIWSVRLRRASGARAWVAFDRFAPHTAMTRYLEAARVLGLGSLAPVFTCPFEPALLQAARERLAAAGWDPARPLVCLNPAGGWETKQWPLERFAELGRRLVEQRGAQLLALCPAPVSERFRALKDALGDALVDLSGQTTPAEAAALLSYTALVVSEDSGLMHAAWTQGVPTLALFGSSRWVWSRPEGPRTAGFNSEDLECGACMQPTCARGDVLCLSRVSVEDALGRALALMRRPS